MNDKPMFYSRAELFRLLENADLPQKEKAEVEKYLKWALFTDDRDLVGMIGDYLLLHQSGTTSFPEGNGDIRFYLGSHVLVVGAPGTGKSILCMKEVARIAKEHDDVTVFWVDIEGDASSVLPSMIEPGKLRVYTRESMHFNPLENVEISDQWLGIWLKAFTEFAYIGDGGYVIASNAGRHLTQPELVRQRGGHATFEEICHAIGELDIRGNDELRRYRNVVQIRLGSLLPTISRVMDCRYGYRPEDLCGHVNVFDVSWMDNVAQLVMQIYLLNYTWFLSAAGILGKTVFIYEEIHRTYRSAAIRGSTISEPSILDAARSSRKDNFVIIFTDHSISAAPDDLLYCADTKVFMRMTDKDDLSAAEKCMLLPPELTVQLASLKNQEAVVFIGGQMERAELHKIPDIDFHQYTIQEVAEMMAPHIAKLDYVPVEEPKTAQRIPDALAVWMRQNRSKIKAFLQALVQHPIKPIGVFSKRLKFNVDETFVRKMAECGLIAYPEKLSFGRSGGSKGLSRHYTEIMPSGAAFIGERYEDVALKSGKNRSLQSKIATSLIFEHRRRHRERPDINVAMEWKQIDVAELVGDTLFAFEYEKSVHPHILENVKRDIRQLGAAKVYVVMDRLEQLREAKALLKAELQESEFKKLVFSQTKEYL